MVPLMLKLKEVCATDMIEMEAKLNIRDFVILLVFNQQM